LDEHLCIVFIDASFSFERFLLQLDAWKLFTLPRGRAKKLRSTAKDLLKKEQNRNNVALFCEFALLEREMGGLEPACKVSLGNSAIINSMIELLVTSETRIYFSF